MKKLELMGVVLFSLFTTTALVACSSDDDEDEVRGNVPSSMLTDKDGNAVLLSSIGDAISFTYDADGKLTSFSDSESEYKVKGGTFVSCDEDGIPQTVVFETNANGLISKVQIKIDYKAPDGSYYRSDITTVYQYNSEQQITSATISGSGESYDREDNEKISGKLSGSMKYTWTNGNLTKGEFEAHETGTDDTTWKNTITFGYEDQTNTIKQMPYCVASMQNYMDTNCGILGLVGLFGVGPKDFPVSCTDEFYYKDEDGEDGYTENYSVIFTLNDNGTIKTERMGDGWFYSELSYQYTTTRSAIVPQMGGELPAMKSAMKFFKRKH